MMLKTGFPRPEKTVLDGGRIRLEPLNAEAHAADLFEAAHIPERETKHRYLFDAPPEALSEMRAWAEKSSASEDPMFFAVIDKATGRAVGRQAMMRIDATHGVAEIGNIYWGPGMARSARATEALFLFMRLLFDDLGYRRFEWKCDDGNEPSKQAALRFGFSHEGLFRQHMIVKGLNRNTAWFSIIDSEWPALKGAYEAWLDDANFDADGRQRRSLSEMTAQALGRA